jgi:hypothetical protein
MLKQPLSAEVQAAPPIHSMLAAPTVASMGRAFCIPAARQHHGGEEVHARTCCQDAESACYMRQSHG